MEELFVCTLEEMHSLYHLYEFTDNILFLSQTASNYPNIFNFVKVGILTEEEAYEGLLH